VIRLAYTQYHREFVCKIENIQELSVQTLQELEDFASQRSGKLDYTTESFTIPKRIELQHLQEIFRAKGMDVFITEHEPKKSAISETATINFGKFKGQKWTDLEEDYLKWLSQNISSQDKQTALAELDRRKKKKAPEKRTETVMFGKHKGELWDDLPTPYLQWVAQNLQGEAQKIAMDVLQRRQ
jgi:uncharacterized protein (DUF3820 family)